MGKISETINNIMKNEGITLCEVYEKYPHLKSLQVQEFNEEKSLKEDKRQLLHD